MGAGERGVGQRLLLIGWLKRYGGKVRGRRMTGAGASDDTSDRVWFISYARPDRAWAKWIAWQLLDAGHEIELDCWDWGTGDNFVVKMNAVLERGRLLALFSPAYFEPGRFATPEWTAMMARQEKITPVRIAQTATPAILGPLIVTDLFGLDDHAAREALLRAVNGPARPDRAPARPPGMLARIGGGGPEDAAGRESADRHPERKFNQLLDDMRVGLTGSREIATRQLTQLAREGRVGVEDIERAIQVLTKYGIKDASQYVRLASEVALDVLREEAEKKNPRRVKPPVRHELSTRLKASEAELPSNPSGHQPYAITGSPDPDGIPEPGVSALQDPPRPQSVTPIPGSGKPRRRRIPLIPEVPPPETDEK